MDVHKTIVDLSILIPARNEEFLSRTIQDILEHIEMDTEVIAVFDGGFPPVPVPQNDRVTIVYNHESIGQRAATNQACRLSNAKYVMKVDAHCAFDQGFDRKLIEDMQDDWTVVPTMRNLHAFDWVCEEGHRRYQGPSGTCNECGKPTEKDVVWIPKTNPQSNSYCFDSEPHFQYFREFNKRPEGQGEITPTMSLQGSCFMMTREKYWELDICDESFGSWGSQGIEVAVKTWLSGGEVMVNKKTWYAHMFRTQGGDFGFPYQLSGNQVEHAKKTARNLFFTNGWDKQVRPLSWLLRKFWPVPGWTENDLAALEGTVTKGILYYTNNRAPVKVARRVQKQLESIGLPITSVSQKPMPHFGRNIHMKLESGSGSMFRQILAGLEAMTEDVVYFAEHDVLYHPSHFDFTPIDRDTFYYNENVWFYRLSDGHCLHYDAKQLSGLVGYREQLITHFRERIELIEKEGFSRRMGYEPMTHGRVQWKYMYKAEGFMSECPNVDIKHDNNLVGQRWSKDQFRNQKYTKGWTEAGEVPCWGKEIV